MDVDKHGKFTNHGPKILDLKNRSCARQRKEHLVFFKLGKLTKCDDSKLKNHVFGTVWHRVASNKATVHRKIAAV
jgi:hypothetical protein